MGVHLGQQLGQNAGSLSAAVRSHEKLSAQKQSLAGQTAKLHKKIVADQHTVGQLALEVKRAQGRLAWAQAKQKAQAKQHPAKLKLGEIPVAPAQAPPATMLMSSATAKKKKQVRKKGKPEKKGATKPGAKAQLAILEKKKDLVRSASKAETRRLRRVAVQTTQNAVTRVNLVRSKLNRKIARIQKMLKRKLDSIDSKYNAKRAGHFHPANSGLDFKLDNA